MSELNRKQDETKHCKHATRYEHIKVLNHIQLLSWVRLILSFFFCSRQVAGQQSMEKETQSREDHTHQKFLTNQRQELLLSCEQLLDKVTFDLLYYMYFYNH